MFSQVRKFSSLSRVIQAPASTTKLSFAATQQLASSAPSDKSKKSNILHQTYIYVCVDIHHFI